MSEIVLLQCESERTDESGKPYRDLYLGWVYDNKRYLVRVRPCFATDFPKLVAKAIDCESADNLEKYL